MNAGNPEEVAVSPKVTHVDVEGRNYGVTFERRIVRGGRSVVATAFDASGQAVRREEATTGGARSFLPRDTGVEPPTWTELETIALDMLTLQLEQ